MPVIRSFQPPKVANFIVLLKTLLFTDNGTGRCPVRDAEQNIVNYHFFLIVRKLYFRHEFAP